MKSFLFAALFASTVLVTGASAQSAAKRDVSDWLALADIGGQSQQDSVSIVPRWEPLPLHGRHPQRSSSQRRYARGIFVDASGPVDR